MERSHKYQVWETHDSEGGVAFAEDRDGLSYEQTNDLLYGRPLEGTLNVTINGLSEGDFPDRLGAAWPCVLVSRTLRGLLEEYCGEDIQFIDVKTLGYPEANYSIANVLVNIPCLNWKASRVDLLPDTSDQICAVRKLVLKELPNDIPPVFHIQELPEALLVRDDLRTQLEATAAKPGLFVPISKFRMG